MERLVITYDGCWLNNVKQIPKENLCMIRINNIVQFILFNQFSINASKIHDVQI